MAELLHPQRLSEPLAELFAAPDGPAASFHADWRAHSRSQNPDHRLSPTPYRSLSAPMDIAFSPPPSSAAAGMEAEDSSNNADDADDAMDEDEDERVQGFRRGLYCLARVDGDTGMPLRLATDKEAEELGRILSLSGNGHLLAGTAEENQDQQEEIQQGAGPVGIQQGERQQEQQGMFLGPGKALGSGVAGRGGGGGGWRGGGPCDHCKATESPQWRRGPVGKPVLCNACGTRYRRTGQLGPPGPASSLRKSRSMTDRKRYNVDDNEGIAPLVFCKAA